MKRIRLAFAIAGLLVTPALAVAQPSITNIAPGKSSANPGTTIDITGAGFGASFADRAYFPGGGFVNPTALIAGGIRVRVPATWSGNVQVQAAGAGPLSNAFNHDISFNYSGQYWPGGSLPFTWFLNNAAAPGCTFNDTRDALITGYNAWSCASGVSASYGGGTVLATTAYDGTNCRYWANAGWSPGTVAVATWWYNASNQILEADIAFNSQHYTWSTAGASTAMDVGNVGTHEEGHTIGLLDMYGGADFPHTMYGYVANGETIRRTLHADDALGAEYIYGHTRANLAAATPAGWWGPVVPRNIADATGGYAPLPATLDGNTTSYLSSALTNNGGDCAAPSSNNQLFLDEEYIYDLWWSGVLGTGFAFGGWTNWGQYVRGGRHTLRWDLDTYQEILESNEFDNTYREQFVWSPYGLSDMSPVARWVPPPRGVMAEDNCDGFQFTGNWWGAAAVMPTVSGEDFDIELFGDYGGSTSGFATELATSAAGGSSIDFVLVNGNIGGIGYGATRQAGVIRFSSGAANNCIVEQANVYGGTTLAPGTAYGTSVGTGTVNMGAYQLIKVHEVYLAAGTAYTVLLSNLSGTADLNISLFDQAGSYFSRFDHLASSQAIGSGTNESFNYTPSVGGFYAVVVWKRNHADLGLANDYELLVGPALSNLNATLTPGGWSSPSVPRNDASFTGVVSPVLDGNTANTYVSYSGHQLGPNPTPGGQLDLDIDGVWSITAGLPNPAVPNMYYVASYGPWDIRGGRHTLSNVFDRPGVIAENDEYDNIAHSQYVWSPQAVAKHTPVVRSMPPLAGYLAQPNSDGLRFDPTSAFYAWVASLAPQNPSDDYDMYVYRDYSGSTSGFSDLAGVSYWGSNATDFVTGHHTAWQASLYPAAVLYSYAGGGGGYASDMSDDFGRYAIPPAVYSGQSLPANRLADVYQFDLIPGSAYYILLHRQSGSDDLQFEVFPPTSGGVFARGGGTSSITMDADDDTLEFVGVDAGWHNLVVFRTDGTQAGTPLSYLLSVSPNVTVDVPQTEAPRGLAFLGAVPNPGRDGANLVFDLPSAGRVRLDVFDVHGRLARAVTDDEWSAGRHSLRWDGRRGDGRAAEPGLYWARFRANGASVVRRFTLIH